ncbi:MAG: metal-dependent transcriptional regulator [Phycisphaerae bacterium]|nr:metal-dependent transcriptional regulator [Phycisphaerae bacterium]
MSASAAKKKLTPSLEDYLEAILVLIRQSRVARVRDIAKRLRVGMPSVTAALKALSKRKLVNYDPYQVITLTGRGREIAEEISRRHHILRRFLTDVLGLDAESADANACRMEHAVDSVLLGRLTSFAKFIHSCPRAGDQWVEAFIKSCSDGQNSDRCEDCLDEALEGFRKLQEVK